MGYKEDFNEAQNPKYENSAKYIWDSIYKIYGESINLCSILPLARIIINAIKMEFRKGIYVSILSLEPPFDNSIKNYLDYLNEHWLDQYLNEHLPLILASPDKFKLVLNAYSNVLKEISPKNIHLIDGGNFDSDFDLWFLSNYNTSMLNKRIYRTNGNSNEWFIDNSICKEENFIIKDVAYIWKPVDGISRAVFLDGHWGILNTLTGKVIHLPLHIQSLSDFKHELSCYYDEEQKAYGYLDFKGKIIISPKFSERADFIYNDTEDSNERFIAFTRYTHAVWYSLTHDKSILEPWDDKEDECRGKFMEINGIEGIISIKRDGGLTNNFQKLYDKQIKAYYDKVDRKRNQEESENFWRSINRNIGDEEDNIMGALGNGYGDIYGF